VIEIFEVVYFVFSFVYVSASFLHVHLNTIPTLREEPLFSSTCALCAFALYNIFFALCQNTLVDLKLTVLVDKFNILYLIILSSYIKYFCISYESVHDFFVGVCWGWGL